MGQKVFKDCVTTTDTTWTAKQLCDYADQGLVKFDNAVQRGLVWNVRQKSLLIHSLIVNFMPPEFLANKINGVYDMIDGKQRHNAISSFLKNEYRLIDVPDLFSESGERYSLNGKSFGELLPEIQEKITGRGLKISVMDGASQDIVREYFFRRNNGLVLTASRKTFSMAQSFDEISILAAHPIFASIFPAGNRSNDESKDIVMKAFVILFAENKSLENKKVFPFIKKAKFQQEQVDILKNCLDTIAKAFSEISKMGTKIAKKVSKRIIKKTHFVMLVPIAKDVYYNGVSLEAFVNWIIHFFDSQAGATISDSYNENSTTGSSQVNTVMARMTAMKSDFENFTNSPQ